MSTGGLDAASVNGPARLHRCSARGISMAMDTCLDSLRLAALCGSQEHQTQESQPRWPAELPCTWGSV